MKLLILGLFLASRAWAADPAPTAGDELRLIWYEHQERLAYALRPHADAYRKALEKLESDAMGNHDTIGAAATRKERESGDLGLAPLAIPGKKTSPRITDLKRFRLEFEHQREEEIRALNPWCRGKVEALERKCIDRNDPGGAEAVRIEREALAKPPLHVVYATYGGSRMIDVTLPVRRAVRFNRIEITGGNNLAGDPVPYQVKRGWVIYRLGNGREKSFNFGEGGTIKIP